MLGEEPGERLAPALRVIACPSCGKDAHSFYLPGRPGAYRVRCQADSGKMITLQVRADGAVVAVEEEGA